MTFDYILQVGNGDQTDEAGDDSNPFDEDNNLNKAINGRFRAALTEELTVGASFYNDGNVYIEDEEDDFVSRFELLTMGGQLEYVMDEVATVQAEYVYGTVAHQGHKEFEDKTITRHAYTVLLAFNGLGDLTPFVRYGMLDPNMDQDNDSANRIIYGINYQVVQGLFFKLEHNLVTGDDDNAHIKKYGSYGEIKASIAAGF
jgi:hypothetical protein